MITDRRKALEAYMRAAHISLKTLTKMTKGNLYDPMSLHQAKRWTTTVIDGLELLTSLRDDLIEIRDRHFGG